MNRKERVASYINSKEYVPLKLGELAAVLGVPKTDMQRLKHILAELTGEGRVVKSKRGRYMPVDIKGSITGTLICNPSGRFGFVACEGSEDIFVSGPDMANALNGDTVIVKLNSASGRGKREGNVICVLERANKTIVGVIYNEKDGYLCLRPDSRRIYSKIYIAPENSRGAAVGDRAAVSDLDYNADGRIYASVTDILGDESSVSGIMEGIIISSGIKREFDAETLTEAAHTAKTVTEREINGREDRRSELIFTIDGDDAKDFDDAVSVERLDNGNFMLHVHIADVSYYVGEGSAIDKEAYERGTSVYLPDRVIPMLPETLSNGICSLRPDEDRLAFTCSMEIDGNGNVINSRLAKTVIRSKERMTYNNVNTLLEGSDAALNERYGYMLPTLREMERLAEMLRNKRMRRGAIDFDFPECHIVMNADGEVEDITAAERGVSNRMIEEFMLAANETVAETAQKAGIPFIYRVHEQPSADKIRDFNKLILRYGLQINTGAEDKAVTPKDFQRVLDEVKNGAGERTVSSEMLRAMMKAKYAPDNLGHFGLAAKYYCHFTSPIRRYPDLIAHRVLTKLINKENISPRGIAEAASHSSETEVAAENAERDSDDLMKAAYMSRFVGESFDAVVSGVTGFGIFVELDNTVEGLVRYDSMTDDYYTYDEQSGTANGKRGGRVYGVGDRVRVTLVRSDILSRQIDFIFEENNL